MPSRRKLTADEIEDAIAKLPGWARDDAALHRVFQFTDFRTAFTFMTSAAFAAEAMNHHPDWANSYRTVDVRLTTHDAGGITQLDVDLAQQMSRLAEPLLRGR